MVTLEQAASSPDSGGLVSKVKEWSIKIMGPEHKIPLFNEQGDKANHLKEKGGKVILRKGVTTNGSFVPTPAGAYYLQYPKYFPHGERWTDYGSKTYYNEHGYEIN